MNAKKLVDKIIPDFNVLECLTSQQKLASQQQKIKKEELIYAINKAFEEEVKELENMNAKETRELKICFEELLEALKNIKSGFGHAPIEDEDCTVGDCDCVHRIAAKAIEKAEKDL